MGRPFLNSIPHTSRFVYSIRCRLAVILLFIGFVRVQHLHVVHQQALAAKYSPTSFDPESDDRYPYFKRTEHDELHLKDELLANRESWRMLGKGWEGKVFSYQGFVIKTFTPGRSPFRNCVPGSAGDSWPTEIPASLLFGQPSRLDSSVVEVEYESSNLTSVDGFLPVISSFKASTSVAGMEEWHLVTPLLGRGNLHKLSRGLREDGRIQSLQDLDTTYRSALNRILKSLDFLHTAGYCHDDIKPANIFVRDELHWILGDLGNLREISHPYHSSRLWRDNGQLEDCRANDVVRTIKSYVSFLRSSMAGDDEFLVAFFRGRDPISRLFWWAMSDAASMSAMELLRRSQIERPDTAKDGFTSASASLSEAAQTFLRSLPRKLTLKRTADAVLATRMGERLTRFWAMVWLFGVPVSGRCGV